MAIVKRHRTASTLGLVLGLILTTGLANAQPASAGAQDSEKQRRASAARTMPDAAKLAGEHYVRPLDTETLAVARNLDDLTKFSGLVVVGELLSGQPVLSDDQMYIKRSLFFVSLRSSRAP